MKSKLRNLWVAAGGLVCVACTTPSATYVEWVNKQKPAEADQYSDFLVGRFASLSNDPLLAAETFVRASAREPQDPILLERAVFSLLLAGDGEQAIELAREASERELEISSLTRLTLGIAEMRQSEYADASLVLGQGDAGMFNRIVSRTISAWSAFGEGQTELAKSNLIESLVGDDVLDGVTLYMLGLLQMSAGEDEQALETFEAVWSERMRLAVACEHYVRLLSNKGENEKALQIVQDFREDVGANPAIEALARQLAAGETLSLRRMTPTEGAAIAVYALATALAVETEDDIASVYFNLALLLDPQLDIARTMLGSTLDYADRREEAIEILGEVSKDSPFYATAQGQLAWAQLRQGNDAAAIQTALSGQEKTGDRDLAIQLGDIYRATGDYENAFYWFNDVITRDEAAGKADWRTYYARAITYHELGNWEAAEADLLKSVELNPRQAQVLNYLGYSWVDRGENLEKGFELIQDAVSLSPNSGYIVDSLGWAYYKLGQFELAVLYLERAVELAADDPTLNDHLGDAYWQVGRELEARFQWKHALALEPEPEDAARIEAKIANGLKSAPASILAQDSRSNGVSVP